MFRAIPAQAGARLAAVYNQSLHLRGQTVDVTARWAAALRAEELATAASDWSVAASGDHATMYRQLVRGTGGQCGAPT